MKQTKIDFTEIKIGDVVVNRAGDKFYVQWVNAYNKTIDLKLQDLYQVYSKYDLYDRPDRHCFYSLFYQNGHYFSNKEDSKDIVDVIKKPTVIPDIRAPLILPGYFVDFVDNRGHKYSIKVADAQYRFTISANVKVVGRYTTSQDMIFEALAFNPNYRQDYIERVYDENKNLIYDYKTIKQGFLDNMKEEMGFGLL